MKRKVLIVALLSYPGALGSLAQIEASGERSLPSVSENELSATEVRAVEPALGLMAIFGEGVARARSLMLHAESVFLRARGPQTLGMTSVRRIEILFKDEFYRELLLGVSTLEKTLVELGRRQQALPLQLPGTEPGALALAINQELRNRLSDFHSRNRAGDSFSVVLDLQGAKDFVYQTLFDHMARRTQNAGLRAFMAQNFSMQPNALPFQPHFERQTLFGSIWLAQFTQNFAAMPALPALSPAEWEDFSTAYKTAVRKNFDQLRQEPDERLRHGVTKYLATLLRRKPELDGDEAQKGRLLERLASLPSYPETRRRAFSQELIAVSVEALASQEPSAWAQHLLRGTQRAVDAILLATPEARRVPPPPPGRQDVAAAAEAGPSTSQGHPAGEARAASGEAAAKRLRSEPARPVDPEAGPSRAEASPERLPLRLGLRHLFAPGSFAGNRLADYAAAVQQQGIRAESVEEDLLHWVAHHTFLELRDLLATLEGALDDLSRTKQDVRGTMTLPEQQAIGRRLHEAVQMLLQNPTAARSSFLERCAELAKLKDRMVATLYEKLREQENASQLPPFLRTYFKPSSQTDGRPFVPKEEYQADFARAWDTNLQRVLAREAVPLLDEASSQVARRYYKSYLERQPAGVEIQPGEEQLLRGSARFLDLIAYLTPLPGESEASLAEARTRSRRWNLALAPTAVEIRERNENLYRAALAQKVSLGDTQGPAAEPVVRAPESETVKSATQRRLRAQQEARERLAQGAPRPESPSVSRARTQEEEQRAIDHLLARPSSSRERPAERELQGREARGSGAGRSRSPSPPGGRRA